MFNNNLKDLMINSYDILVQETKFNEWLWTESLNSYSNGSLQRKDMTDGEIYILA